MSIRSQVRDLEQYQQEIAGKIKEAQKEDTWERTPEGIVSRKNPNARVVLLQSEYDSNERRIQHLVTLSRRRSCSNGS